MRKVKMRKVTYGFLLLVGLFAFLAQGTDTETQTPATSATVNVYVDTSLSSASIAFGNLDPGTTDSAATGNPLTLTNTANSNTAIDTYLQATNLTKSGAFIGVGNLSVAKTAGGAKTPLVSSGYLTGAGPNAGYYENTSVSGTADFYFFLSIPTGQAAGAYSGTVTMKSVADGNTP